MSVCSLCENEFILPKSSKQLDKLIFSENEGFLKYMCLDCYNERSNADFRYHNGHLLCNAKGCGRNAMSFSNFCFKCDGFEV